MNILVNGNKEQVNKVWKLINRKDGCWNWIRVKVIADAYSTADAKGRERFCQIGIEQCIKNITAVQIKKQFIDKKTGIKYRVYKFYDGYIYRDTRRYGQYG